MIGKWINHIKLGLKLIRFSLQFQTNMVVLGIFTVIGVAVDILARGVSFFGIYFLAIIPLYASQLLNAVMITGAAQSSAKKRAVMIDIPAAFSFLSMTVSYVVLALLRLLYIKVDGRLSKIALLGLLYYGMILLLMHIYNVFVFRKPVIGYTVLAVMIFFFSFTGGFSYTYDREDTWPAAAAVTDALTNLPLFDHPLAVVLLGYVFILINLAVFYALSLAMYKMPLSERIYKQALARAKGK